MDVQKLEGAELDLAVSKHMPEMGRCEIEEDGACWEQYPTTTDGTGDGRKILARQFSPSSCWFDGGPIIEDNEIAVWYDGEAWGAANPWPSKHPEYAPTPLIAAMRAFVASKTHE